MNHLNYAIFSCCCIVWAIGLHGQTSLVLDPTKDASIGYHDNYPSANTNYNSALHFSAFSQPGNLGGLNTGRSVIDFDLSAIPSDAIILGAYLNLSAIGPFGGTGEVATVGHVGQNACTLQRITENWDDNTITWNNQPTTTTDNAAPLQQSTYNLQNYLLVDVTALVQDMQAMPSTSFGMMLKLNTETATRGLAFHSGLAPQADKRPQLLVVYSECIGAGIAGPAGPASSLLVSPTLSGAGDRITIDLPQAAPGTYYLDFTDASGRIVETRSVMNWPYAYVVPNVASGVFFFTVRNGSNATLARSKVVIGD